MAEDVTQQADAAFRKRVAELRHLSTISQGSNAALQQQLAAENAQLTEDLDTVRAKLQSARRKLLVGDAEGTNANDEEMNIEMARTTADENQGSDSTQLELFSPAPALRTPAATPVRAMALNSNRYGSPWSNRPVNGHSNTISFASPPVVPPRSSTRSQKRSRRRSPQLEHGIVCI